MTDNPFTIREVSERTGLSVATLRAWEQRYDFPTPQRDEHGHRRYDVEDCARIAHVMTQRAAGLSLVAAIASATATAPTATTSIYGEVRRLAPTLTPHAHTMRNLFAVSHAVEDECSATADRPVVVAAFQTEAAYRREESRWRHLAEGAAVAIVLARFHRRRTSGTGPLEIPFAPDARLRDEWAVVAHSPSFAVALTAWERPTPTGTPPSDRVFEAVWTVDRDVVRRAVEVALEVGRVTVAVENRVRTALDRPATTVGASADDAIRIANRMVAYVAKGAATA